jgi:hypothetical protein
MINGLDKVLAAAPTGLMRNARDEVTLATRGVPPDRERF